MNYPPGSEYEYLNWLIYQDYLVDDDREVEPAYRAENAAFHGDSDAAYEQAHQQRVEAVNRIVENRRRREDIVYWLYWDTQLRQNGKTYPDVYERVEQP